MKVECIDGVDKERTTVGEVYYVNNDSITLDVGGNAYGNVYTDEDMTKFLGRKLLKRFKTVL